jgi:hypothetical protein
MLFRFSISSVCFGNACLSRNFIHVKFIGMKLFIEYSYYPFLFEGYLMVSLFYYDMDNLCLIFFDQFSYNFISFINLFKEPDFYFIDFFLYSLFSISLASTLTFSISFKAVSSSVSL